MQFSCQILSTKLMTVPYSADFQSVCVCMVGLNRKTPISRAVAGKRLTIWPPFNGSMTMIIPGNIPLSSSLHYTGVDSGKSS